VARSPGWLRKPADAGWGRNVSVVRRRVSVEGSEGASIVAYVCELRKTSRTTSSRKQAKNKVREVKRQAKEWR